MKSTNCERKFRFIRTLSIGRTDKNLNDKTHNELYQHDL